MMRISDEFLRRLERAFSVLRGRDHIPPASKRK